MKGGGNLRNENLVWRSQLYVPANNPRFIEKAHTRGSDVIILDLEDSVPPAERDRARQGLVEAIESVGQSGVAVTVRINSPKDEATYDLEAAVTAGVRGLFVSKVRNRAYIKAISARVAELESERGLTVGGIKLVVMIETAEAYLHAYDIACADPRILALVLGGEDIALDIGAVPDTDTLAMPKQHIAITARAAGIIPFGMMGTIADYGDLTSVQKVAVRSRKFGFEGAACIHPSVVPVLNAAFTPSQTEVDSAQRILVAYAEAESKGIGAISLDGKMIDVPVVRRAKNLMTRMKAIEQIDG